MALPRSLSTRAAPRRSGSWPPGGQGAARPLDWAKLSETVAAGRRTVTLRRPAGSYALPRRACAAGCNAVEYICASGPAGVMYHPSGARTAGLTVEPTVWAAASDTAEAAPEEAPAEALTPPAPPPPDAAPRPAAEGGDESDSGMAAKVIVAVAAAVIVLGALVMFAKYSIAWKKTGPFASHYDNLDMKPMAAEESDADSTGPHAFTV